VYAFDFTIVEHLSAEHVLRIAQLNHTSFVKAHAHVLSDEALSKCTVAAFEEGWSKYPNPKAKYGFAYNDQDELLGFAVVSQCRHAGLESYGELRSLYVHPSHQRKGIGNALLKWSMDAMRATANGRMYVVVVAANASREFYIRTGAVPVTALKRDVFGDMLDMDVLCYESRELLVIAEP